MNNQSLSQPQLKLNLKETARKPFVEPEILTSLDVLESTSLFQVATGGFDFLGDITEG